MLAAYNYCESKSYFQRQQFSVDELEELAKDARLIKKFKAGKVSINCQLIVICQCICQFLIIIIVLNFFADNKGNFEQSARLLIINVHNYNYL